LLALYVGNYLLSTVVAKLLLPRGDAIALVYGTVMRNLSIALALAMNAFGSASSDAALVITLAYIIQVQSAAWYVIDRCSARSRPRKTGSQALATAWSATMRPSTSSMMRSQRAARRGSWVTIRKVVCWRRLNSRSSEDVVGRVGRGCRSARRPAPATGW
jgi:hypothetical protein